MLNGQRGFSLVEILLAIVIFAALMMIGISSYRSWIESVQVRNGAESVLNALQLARAEAIRRNKTVNLVLSDMPGTSWAVQVGAPPVDIETRAAADGSRRVRVVMEAGGTNVISFNAFGRLAAGTQFDLRFEGTSGDEDVRRLKVRVEPSGDARMCDPALEAAHVQGCPA